jgi:tetratricopeptide (TPR) repeat protein
MIFNYIFRIVLVFITSILLFVEPVKALDINSCYLNHAEERSLLMVYPASQDTWKVPESYNLHLWSLYCKLKNGELGIHACNCAIAANPGNAINWNNLGQKFFRLGKYEEALNSYNHGLLIEMDNSLILANRCGALSMLNRFPEALDSCDLALEGNGRWGFLGEALVWDNRGDALFNLGRYQEALVSFERAIKLNPDYKNAIINRAIVLYKLEKDLNKDNG